MSTLGKTQMKKHNITIVSDYILTHTTRLVQINICSGAKRLLKHKSANTQVHAWLKTDLHYLSSTYLYLIRPQYYITLSSASYQMIFKMRFLKLSPNTCFFEYREKFSPLNDNLFFSKEHLKKKISLPETWLYIII